MKVQVEKYLARFGATLSGGARADPAKGRCAMEAVAWLAGEEHSDHPDCACPVVSAYVRNLNDAMPGSQRQRLWDHLCRLIGSLSPEHEAARAEYLATAAVTRFLPVALRAEGLESHARACESAQTLVGVQCAAATRATATHAARTAAAMDAMSGALDIGNSGERCDTRELVEAAT